MARRSLRCTVSRVSCSIFIERARPTHIAVAFDESLTTSFRNEIYPAYKAHRDLAPPELMVQFALCKEIAAALGVTVLADAKYEADDLIGSALIALRMAGFRSVIVSADKDFGQLIGDGDEQWDPQRNQRWDAHGVKARLGVRPDQVADYLALTGDSVDNIPGVPGIGAEDRGDPARSISARSMRCSNAHEEVAFLRMRGAAAACDASSRARGQRAAFAAAQRHRARRAGSARRRRLRSARVRMRQRSKRCSIVSSSDR